MRVIYLSVAALVPGMASTGAVHGQGLAEPERGTGLIPLRDEELPRWTNAIL